MIKKMGDILILYISILIFFLVILSTTCNAIGVRPLTIDLKIKPGRER